MRGQFFVSVAALFYLISCSFQR